MIYILGLSTIFFQKQILQNRIAHSRVRIEHLTETKSKYFEALWGYKLTIAVVGTNISFTNETHTRTPYSTRYNKSNKISERLKQKTVYLGAIYFELCVFTGQMFSIH